MAISSYSRPHPLLTPIIEYLTRLHSRHKTITFCWVPAHCNVPGNEHADRCARLALSLPSPPSLPLSLVPATDLYPSFLSSLRTTFSSSWSLLTAHPHLHNVFPSFPSSPLPPLPTRFLDVLRSRLLLGHTRFSHGHLMCNQPPQPCPFCAAPPPIFINHVLF